MAGIPFTKASYMGFSVDSVAAEAAEKLLVETSLAIHPMLLGVGGKRARAAVVFLQIGIGGHLTGTRTNGAGAHDTVFMLTKALVSAAAIL